MQFSEKRSGVTLDMETARDNFGGDESLIRDIGEIFLEDIPALLQQLDRIRPRLTTPADTGSPAFTEAKHVAHSIKGLAGTFGAEPLRTLIANIESDPSRLAGPAGSEHIRELLAVAEQTIAALQEELR